MILVFGTVCLDRVRRITELPKAGGYSEVREEHEMLGGEAANTASALTLWRVEVCLAGNGLGSGFESDRLRMLILEKGIPDDLLTHAGPTPICEVYVTDDGDRTMFGRGFAAMSPAVSPGSLPYEAGCWFTAESNMRAASREAAWRAHEAGMRVYTMDFHHEEGQTPPGSIAQFSTDWVGGRGGVERNLDWIGDWARRNGSTGILTDGAAGLYVGFPDGRTRRYPAFPAPRVVDSTGAGDVFRAGVLHGLATGCDFGEALAFGSAAAALKIGSLGANEGIPFKEEVEAHLAAHPGIADAYRT